MKCAVKGCCNYYLKTVKTPEKRVQYFRFPKDQAISLKWLEVCKEGTSIATGRICSKHFEPSSFTKSLQQKLLQYSPKSYRKLQSDVIPTLHLFPELQDTPSTSFDSTEGSSSYIENTIDTPTAAVAASSTSFDSTEGSSSYIKNTIDTPTAAVAASSTSFDSTKTLQQKLASMNKKYQILQRKERVTRILRLKDQLNNKKLNMRLIAMKKKMRQYKQHQSENNDKFNVKMHEILKNVFTPGQIRMLLNPSQKRIVWSSEDIASAMSLRCVSPKAYRYLKNVMYMPLPSLQTLRKWASNIDVGPDPPHLLKLIRNHLIDNGFAILGCKVDKKCIERILAINAKDLKVTFNISQYHLDVQGSERQKVLPAAQLLSDRLATAIEWYGHNGYLAQFDWAETAQVLRLCNDWFDVFNSSSKFGKHEKKNAYGVNLTAQNNILSEMNKFMNQVKIGRHKSLLRFQKGIIITNNSLQQLLPYIKDLCSNFNVEYILTRRLDQDVLENFFSFIRATGGANDQPTALDFMYRLRNYILGKQSVNLFCNIGSCNVRTESVSSLISSESCSVLSETINPYILEDEPEKEEEEILFLDDFNNNDNNNNVSVCDLKNYQPTTEEEQLLTSLDEINIIEIIEDEGLKYVAGYVAYRYKTLYPNLGVQTSEMRPASNVDVDWIQFISKGKCMYPSDDLLTATRIMNVEFENYHGPNLRKTDFIFNELADIVCKKILPIILPPKVILCLVRTRTYIRVREINREICKSNRRKNKKKKLSKFTNNKVY